MQIECLRGVSVLYIYIRTYISIMHFSGSYTCAYTALFPSYNTEDDIIYESDDDDDSGLAILFYFLILLRFSVVIMKGSTLKIATLIV